MPAAGSGPWDRSSPRKLTAARASTSCSSHTHWDHIQGLPFFQPLYPSGNAVRIYGAAQSGVPLEEILDRQMDPVVFPVPLKALAAELTITRGGQRGRSRSTGSRSRRTGCGIREPRWAFRLVPLAGGASLAYVTDNELGPGGSYDVPPGWRDGLVAFLAGVRYADPRRDVLRELDRAAGRVGALHPAAGNRPRRGQREVATRAVSSRAGARR